MGRREKRAQGSAGGGFNWTELDRGVRAQIRRHLRETVSFTSIYWQNWPVPYYSTSAKAWWSQRIRNIQRLPVRFTLSFDRVRESVVDVAPQLTVTFSTQLRPEDFLEEQAAERRRHNEFLAHDEFRELSASELESLCAQVDRTSRWRNVHTIRVIGWPGHPAGPRSPAGPTSRNNTYSLEFVSRDQHGNEVTSTLDADGCTITITAGELRSLEDRVWDSLRLTLTQVHLATPRRRKLPRPAVFPASQIQRDYVHPASEFSNTRAAEWRVPRRADPYGSCVNAVY